MTVTMFGCVILIFTILLLRFLFSLSADREETSHSRQYVLYVRQKHSTTLLIFKCLLGVRKCGQTLSFVFDIYNDGF